MAYSGEAGRCRKWAALVLAGGLLACCARPDSWRAWAQKPPSASTASALNTSAAARQAGPVQYTEEQKKALDEMLALIQRSAELREQKKAGEAVPLMERAVSLGEKFVGESFALALSLDLLGGVHRELGDLDRAETLFRRALAVRQKVQGAEHPDVAATLSALAAIYSARQDFARAEAHYRSALAAYEKALGAGHPSVAITLYGLAFTHSNRGQHGRAEPLLRRALAILEKEFGPEHHFTALALNNLAYVSQQQGDYEQAEPLYLRSITTQEKLHGAQSPEVATSLVNLAGLYREKGDYLRAEPLLRRALAITEKALGAEHEDVAIALNSLGLLYTERGDDEGALPLFERALKIYEKTVGPENSAAAATLNSIAYIYNQRRDYARAESLYRRALSIVEKTLGAESPLYASALSNLAVNYADRGDYAQAEALVKRSLAIREKVLGPSHPDVAVTLNSLAYLYFVRQEFVKEEPLYRRAVEIAEKALGPEHPTVGTYLANLSTIYWARGDTGQALQTLERVAELRERNLALILTTGSEEQKRRYMQTLVNETEANIAFHATAGGGSAGDTMFVLTNPLRGKGGGNGRHDYIRYNQRDYHPPSPPTPSSPSPSAPAAVLALTTLLRRKGRVLDVMADQIAGLRRRLDPQDRVLLDRLSAARGALARLVLKGAGGGDAAERQAEKSRLEAEIERLEAEVGARSAEFRTQERPVTLEGVQGAVPADAALVEMAVFRPYDPRAAVSTKRFGAPRYVAYVLRASGDPAWVDLGEAAGIDREVELWRRALVRPSSADVRERARALDEMVLRPVRRLLGGARHLLLSPDGALNLIPFGALVDETGRYLIENFSITYLTSGRDLLRLQTGAPSRQESVVIASPLFDAAGVAQTAAGPPARGEQGAPAVPRERSLRSAELANVNFTPLPGTKGEAAALSRVLPGARVLTDAHATEAALKQVNSPRILHVATHGFFLPDQARAAAEDARGLLLGGGTNTAAATGENPLLRSGLALAGANLRRSAGGEDGVFTALEASALDLWGTKLVVLSACETGVGDVKTGDGVYGLRRALVLAGSESQVMSLWQVDDAATRDLMVEYYRRLQAGEGRTEALRQVQLEMINGLTQDERRPGQGEAARPQRDRGLAGQTPAGGGRDRRHPFFWAAFIQSGEWRAISDKPSAPK